MISKLMTAFIVSASADEYVPAVEVIRNLKIEKDSVSITVDSQGCTGKEAFEMKRIKKKFALLRLTPDECKGIVPEGEKLFYTFKELKLGAKEKFKLTNKIKKK